MRHELEFKSSVPKGLELGSKSARFYCMRVWTRIYSTLYLLHAWTSSSHSSLVELKCRKHTTRPVDCGTSELAACMAMFLLLLDSNRISNMDMREDAESNNDTERYMCVPLGLSEIIIRSWHMREEKAHVRSLIDLDSMSSK